LDAISERDGKVFVEVLLITRKAKLAKNKVGLESEEAIEVLEG
jgi:hypothetical protein